jgi:4-amino-4-deoxy-L-arabinose transferase-like glycosyltransferase
VTSRLIDRHSSKERQGQPTIAELGAVRFLACNGLLLLAIAVGIALRFANLGGVPPSLHQDEAVGGYDAYSLAATGRDHHGHPFPFVGLESFGDWTSPLLTFLTVPVVGLFGLRVEVLRGVTATIGVLAIPIIYLLGAELFRRRSIGVVAAWLMAVSPWHVHRGHFAIPPSAVPTMVAITMLAVIWALHHRSSRGTVLAAVAAGLTMASYPTMKLYVPLLLLAALVIYAPTIGTLSREALCYAAVVFLVIAGPIWYLSLVDPGGRARLQQVSAFTSQEPSAGFLLEQYRAYFSPWVMFVAGDEHPARTATPPGLGVEPWSTIPLLLAGGVAAVLAVARPPRPEDRRAALFLLAALVAYPIPGSLTLPSPHLGRAIHLIPLLALFGGIGAAALADLVGGSLRVASASKARCALVVTATAWSLTFGSELAFRYTYYFSKYAVRDNVLDYYQYGVEESLEYSRECEEKYDEIWIEDVNQPYIFVLFYAQWSPSDVHQHLRVRRSPPEFNDVQRIGKYHFGDPPPNGSDQLAVLETVRDPNGRTAYEIRGGQLRDDRRVLLVRKP